GVFAEAVSGNVVGREAALAQDIKSGGGNSEQGGLRVFGLLELVFRTFKAEAGDGEVKRGIGFVEHAARSGVLAGESFAHAGELRALAGKEECGLGCQIEIIAGALRYGSRIRRIELKSSVTRR